MDREAALTELRNIAKKIVNEACDANVMEKFDIESEEESLALEDDMYFFSESSRERSRPKKGISLSVGKLLIKPRISTKNIPAEVLDSVQRNKFWTLFNHYREQKKLKP